MRGKISSLQLYDVKKPYGLIEGYDQNLYYFNQDNLLGKVRISELYADDVVEFVPTPSNAKYPIAQHVKLIEQTTLGEIKYAYSPGLPRRMELAREAEHHLKPDSGELEVIQKLSQVLAITRIGHHDMDQSSRHAFCLAGTTELLKQFVRENGEFIVIFSHFPSEMLQQKTLNVERELRHRRDIADRRPLVNFYFLISNAKDLMEKVDREKGKPHAAILPFSFEELLACQDKAAVEKLILQRFQEYYFEINLLAENDAIDDDNLLFGDRGKIADAILSRCHQRNNSGIFGLRRSGKSSVLRAVQRRLDWSGVPYVHLEGGQLETTDWIAALYDISEKIREAMASFIQQGDPSIPVPKKLSIGRKIEEYDRRPSLFVDDVKEYCQSQLLVITIDEIEHLTYNTATFAKWKSLETFKGFWGMLRDCGCPMVLCGVNSTINEKGELVYNGDSCKNPLLERIISCTESAKTYLPPFTAEQTLTMINQLGGYSNIGFSNVYSQINDEFGGHPYAIRQFCSYVFDDVKDKRRLDRVFEVERPTCEKLLRDFRSDSRGIELCKTILEHLRIYPDEYNLLKRIALSPEKVPTISVEELSCIDHLQKYGLILRDPNTNYVTFRIGIIRDFLCRTEQKVPEDMSNDERRRFVQDRVANCERKLKTYVLRTLRAANRDADFRRAFMNYDQNPRCNFNARRGTDPASCSLEDFFSHKKFDFYFSFLKQIILDYWDEDLGNRHRMKYDFMDADISKSNLITYMENLNAGRSDADHYDASDLSICPDDWEISEDTLIKFKAAYTAFEAFFAQMGL